MDISVSQLHLILIFFIYGLAFFTMGLAMFFEFGAFSADGGCQRASTFSAIRFFTWDA